MKTACQLIMTNLQTDQLLSHLHMHAYSVSKKSPMGK